MTNRTQYCSLPAKTSPVLGPPGGLCQPPRDRSE